MEIRTNRYWSHVSDEAKDLISKLLVVNIDDRITAKQALQSEWMAEDEKKLISRDLSHSVITIKNRKNRLQNLARAFMAFGKVRLSNRAMMSRASGGQSQGTPTTPTVQKKSIKEENEEE